MARVDDDLSAAMFTAVAAALIELLTERSRRAARDASAMYRLVELLARGSALEDATGPEWIDLGGEG